MLNAKSRKPGDTEETEFVESVKENIEELANLASNLTRAVAEKQHDKLSAKE